MFPAVVNDIRDIKPPLYFKTNFFFLVIIGTTILLIVFTVLGILIYKKFKKKETPPLGKAKSAHETAGP